MLMQNRKCLVLQERMYFRNIPLSDWIEHEIHVEDGADVTRLVQDMTDLRQERGVHRRRPASRRRACASGNNWP